MRVRIKILDRQRFHLVKHIISDIAHRSLADIDHDSVIQI